VEIRWKGRVDKETIAREMSQHTYFVYRTYLDNYPNVLLEAMASNMRLLVNDFPSLSYMLPSTDMICSTESDMLDKILHPDDIRYDISSYDRDSVMYTFYDFINMLP
jgi:hypothetical protein